MARRQTIIIDNGIQRPTRTKLCQLLHHNFHWKCLFSTLLVHICAGYAVWCHCQDAYGGQIILSYAHGPCAQGYNFIPIVFGILLYLIYLTECWHDRSKNDCYVYSDVTQTSEYLTKLKTATPIVWWKSVCYHYLRRSRQVTRYRNGDAVTATQIYYERINTHTAGNVFMYDLCGVRDISKPIVDLDRYHIVKIKLSKGFVFACLQAANEFEDQRTRFFNENETRDDYMEVREGLDLVEIPFLEHMMVYDKKPWFIRPTVYWTASVLLLSWPLRIITEICTGHVNYHVTKLFGTNYLSPSSANYTGPLTRTSTMESNELEQALRGNFLIVPSYSEAVLLDPLSSNAVGPNVIYPNMHARIRGDATTSYGAITTPTASPNIMPPPAFSVVSNNNGPNRSKSMTFTETDKPSPGTSSCMPPVLSRQSSGKTGKREPPRSISISGISLSAKTNRYQQFMHSSRDQSIESRPLIEPMSMACHHEPPPPYELALRMCAPIYQRIRQSANSISSIFNSASRSSSKDLRQYSLDGPPPPSRSPPPV